MLNEKKVGRKIGEGGQGAVYLYNTNKVIKVSKKQNDNRMLKEYKLAKRAGNKNIGPKVYNYGTHGPNYVWYTMNYVKNGKSIRNVPNKKRFKNEAYNKVQKLHNMGIAHFNLHEDNIIIGSDGKLYIIDFGAAGHVNGPVTNNGINAWLKQESKGEKWHRFYKVNSRKLLSNRNELVRIFGAR